MSFPAILTLSIIAALIPTLLYIGLIYWVDRYEKEPWWLLVATFLWGAVPSIVIAFIFNTTFSLPVSILMGGGDMGNIVAAALIAPPVEETVKGLALLAIFFLWRHEIDSPLDGIIYGAMVGMGFALVENAYYFVDQFNQGGMEAWGINVFMRGVVFGLNHALFSSATGLGIAVARLSIDKTRQILAPLLGWMAAMFLHFLHNLTVSLGNWLCIVALFFDWGGVLLLLGIMLWALLQERSWLKEYLKEEVALGTLTLKQYQTACSGRKRFWYRVNTLTHDGWQRSRRAARFFMECSHLAYKKHHFALFEDGDSRERIGRLRQKIRILAQQLTF